jgi:hypothetical protein
MRKSAINLACLFIALVIFSLIGCAGGTRGKLKRVQQPTEWSSPGLERVYSLLSAQPGLYLQN